MRRHMPRMIAVLSLFCSSNLFAAETAGGATLNRPSSARSAGLGDAMSARASDFSAFVFTPAVLSTLKEKQASFFFERGIDQGGFGKVEFGAPTANAGF